LKLKLIRRRPVIGDVRPFNDLDMHRLTKNSAVSQAVLWIGCLISGVGLLFDPTKTLFVIGLTMVSSGMFQSYYGSVLEIETAKRGWYHLLGIPLIILIAYVTSISLRDYLALWYWILAVVIVTLCLQFAISLIGIRIWSYWQRTSKMT
jgi:hypothetical protein